MPRARRLTLAVAVGTALLSACSVDSTAPEASRTVESAIMAGGPAAQMAGRDFVEGQIVVRFRPGSNGAQVANENGGSLRREMRLARTYVLDVTPGSELETVAKLARHPNVEFAEPDYLIQLTPCEVGICAETNDSFRAYKWDLHNTGSFFNFALAPASTVITGAADSDIDWQEMYDYFATTGGGFPGQAVIGIIDTGIRTAHQDLVAKVIGGRRFVTGGGGVTDFQDDHGHGTHVAGIAAANANNALGVMGVGYHTNVKLLAVKVCTSGGTCPSTAVADGITWAADNGANILNLSLGGGSMAATGSALQRAALQYALSRNVLAFCATGNDALLAGYAPGGDLGVSFPARFPECVAVGSTSWSDTRAGYSNYGAGIELAAPGGDAPSPFALILSLSGTSNTGYNWRSGTSMATPQAAGLAAVLYANGMTDVNSIRARLQQTADDKGAAGYDLFFGHGRINAYRAVTGLNPNAPPVSLIGGPYDGLEGSPVAFDGSASYDPNGKPISWSWAFGDGASGTGATPSRTYADNGTYSVTLRVTDQSGLVHESQTDVAIGNVAPTVSATLSGTAVPSGTTVSASATFTDPGALDAPWNWSIGWGTGAATTGAAIALTETIEGSRLYCVAGSYTVLVSVTDKDGGTGIASEALVVQRIGGTIIAPAAVNVGGNGTLPVQLLSSATFDATTVDPSTLTLGNGVDAEAAVAKRVNGSWMASVGDVNGDGRADLVVHFQRGDLVANGDLHSATTQLVMLGRLGSCVEFRAAATVKAVP